MSKCNHCGEELDGLMAHVNHRCAGNTIVIKQMSDNEIRTRFIEMGMPNMGFESMGFATPTPMERVIFEEEKTEPVYVLPMSLDMNKKLNEWLNGTI